MSELQTDFAQNSDAVRTLIADSLRQAFKAVGGAKEIEKMTGIPQRTLEAYARNETSIPGDRLLSITRAVTFLAPDSGIELLAQMTSLAFHQIARDKNVKPREMTIPAGAGKGKNLLEFLSRQTGNDTKSVLLHDTDELVELPLYNVRLSAGEGDLVSDEAIVDTRAFRKSWIENVLRATPAALKLAVAHGDSMEPTIHDGDLVMIDTRDAGPKREDIYVLRWGEDVLVKRLQRLPVGGFRVVSDNARYEPINLMPAQIQEYGVAVIGRVVWWAHTNVR